MLEKKTVREFIEELASSSPAPGGGSVSAISASLASALTSMVCNLTVGKKSYNELEEDKKASIDETLKACEELKFKFLDLMNEDTKVFLELMKTFKMPKDTEEEKKVRSEKIQLGYKKSLEVPLSTAKAAFELYKHILIAAQYGNKNAVSDAGVAALMTQSAIEAAILNVKINMSSIKDEEYKSGIEKDIENISSEGTRLKEEILKIVNSKI
ncbi:formiminotransferase-cyclodeaminase family protein [Clostridium argentinense CDC 2741]|uniref:Formiminotransferase-cyclodeaminase family protein n=1 Tax=Clostridium argentinense CDC 2741 TaxID=1418104 RepID=A0A0C1UK20_9CLOT|nr:cyclodeaminase/cyclohydrolase family protein [Clostridium argentinense]ARC84514.1 methenyltetrahydrofolate cyclohydrolase [Clostridium argentinense]KIE47635.1 formiminotransferase-cyclodeaminase family protein [Clostridium argentinense CDC 2741]NFF38702.1 cyclodeaminase/cyclohydrolase family protein [Clostridium argentinense]NFP48927.1 cyclodeaminase/cyclohydrolase family protein [Clostridium argentinense]NFP72923.1 cyclodeaminase/cyclohydrolase family protein [Clostridium argentinense]